MLAIPNVSEGRDKTEIRRFIAAAESAGARALDVHSDPVHNRSVITITGHPTELVAGLARLAAATGTIDLRQHAGSHPRLGGLDVCPIVPHQAPMRAAKDVARAAAAAIATTAGFPVYLYGLTATREGAVKLAAIRRGGLLELIDRAKKGFSPDFGPKEIDVARGVVCVGARDVLIAFNVWTACDEGSAKHIASSMRAAAGSLGVQALGMTVQDSTLSQVSMNLTNPAALGIDQAYEEVAAYAGRMDIEIIQTEIVGLVPARFLPDPRRETAKLLINPARSLESALQD